MQSKNQFSNKIPKFNYITAIIENHDICTYINTFIDTYINNHTIWFSQFKSKIGIFLDNFILKSLKTISFRTKIWFYQKFGQNWYKQKIESRVNGRILSSYYCFDYTKRYCTNLRFWITSVTQWRKSSLGRGHFSTF